jgi:protein-S-isoprenylcysteine O-methyltransferase Ste14
MLRTVRKLVVAFVGMLGLRLDQAAWKLDFIAWVALFSIGGLAYGQLFIWGDYSPDRLKKIAVGYAVVVWLLYNQGNSVVLGTRLRQWMRDTWGEQRARRYNNLALGIVFQHQGLVHGAVMETWTGTLSVPYVWTLYILGIALAVIGGGIKLWSTYVTSLDIYYYNDMFIGRAGAPESELILRGPYRWFKNPMYSVGNLQAYGSALMDASWQGLIIAGVFHASLYAFYFLLERPFVRRSYAAPEP